MQTVTEIYEQMTSCYQEKTGMELGASCDLAVRLYAAAAQIYALYSQSEWVVRQCFPQTAQGKHLDYHGELRSLTRKQATCAEGSLRFVASYPGETDRVIPKGSVAMTAGLIRFETVKEAVLAAGETVVTVAARAVEPGTAGNVAAGAVVSMAAIPVGLAGCTNPTAFTGGADEESDESLRERILDSYLRLPNGANAAYYEQEALSFESVAAVSVIPRGRGVGTVDVVIATLAGVPGAELLEEVAAFFQKSREIAVDVQVIAPQTVAVPVTVKITPAEGVALSAAVAAVQRAITGWFSGKRLGKKVLRAELSSLIFDCDEVANCEITLPAADVAITERQLPVLGTLRVEEKT